MLYKGHQALDNKKFKPTSTLCFVCALSALAVALTLSVHSSEHSSDKARLVSEKSGQIIPQKLSNNFIQASSALASLCPRLKGSSGDILLNDILSVTQIASKEFDVDRELVLAVLAAESRCKVDARSSAGALGAMQLMPATVRWLEVSDPFSLKDSVNGGARYLALLLTKFNGDARLALAAYNAGPTRVKRLGTVPPFKETRSFVKRVLSFYNVLRGEPDATTNA